MPSHGLNTSRRTARRLATGTRFGPVSGLTGDKICLLSVSWKRNSGPVLSHKLSCAPNDVKRPALGDPHEVRSPLTSGVRGGAVCCALRGPTHSGEGARGSPVPALG